MQVSFGDRVAGAVNAHLPTLGPALSRFESWVLRDDLATVAIRQPIYVTGFARAGTTLLLELLNAHPDTTSHRYADYRMLWTPYWWNTLRQRAMPGPGPAMERAHRDRIRVTFESPEAFEEVLWMHYFPQLHQQRSAEHLTERDRNPAFERELRAHIAKLLLVRGARRYLAKANYHVTRIPLIASIFPDAKFVVPVREPLAHVASLVRQDAIFSAAGRHSDAVRKHLQRIGHFEFGLDKRVVMLPDAAASRAALDDWESGRLASGYARQWASVYGNLMDTLEARPALQNNVLLVRYEDLCANPVATLDQVFAHCGLLDEHARAIINGQADSITKADYYDVDFDDAIRQQVASVTMTAARRLGYPPAGTTAPSESSIAT